MHDSEREMDEALIDTSLAAAREAALFHRAMEGAYAPGEALDKGASDWVTTVDVESARMIVDLVRKRFPHHAILAEDDPRRPPGDAPSRPSASRRPDEAAGSDEAVTWIIDPLDGTTNWLHGYPACAVSIATMDRRGLRTGVVVNSGNGEEFVARRGGGATRDGEPIRVSRVDEVGLALLGTGFPFKKLDLLPGYLASLGMMLRNTSGVRRAGAAALDLCDLACGRLDGFWEHWLMSWDVAAGALIVTEAGGTFGSLPSTDDAALVEAVSGGKKIARAFAGQAQLTTELGGGFLAGNGRLEPILRELWSEALLDL
ncbi:inositol monophosphatase family protein [Candidatus Palauibacter sp.]|uniref:inositol monophosphatase family protein n=1 Tax=Candidatus Palauibacter sp. TaxID=3101350 RepID=UPI003B01FE03